MSEANESDAVSEANESDAVSEANESDAVSEANESDAVSAANEEPTPAKPVLRVVKGDLTAEELAALVAVVAARNAAAANAASRGARKPRTEWGHPARSHRAPHRVGPDQWRRSAWG